VSSIGISAGRATAGRQAAEGLSRALASPLGRALFSPWEKGRGRGRPKTPVRWTGFEAEDPAERPCKKKGRQCHGFEVRSINRERRLTWRTHPLFLRARRSLASRRMLQYATPARSVAYRSVLRGRFAAPRGTRRFG